MATLILTTDVNDLIREWEGPTDSKFIKDWFSYHLNRLWGLNVDIRNVTVDSSYCKLIHNTLSHRQYELFWRIRMPAFTDSVGYTCKIQYLETTQQLQIHFS